MTSPIKSGFSFAAVAIAHASKGSDERTKMQRSECKSSNEYKSPEEDPFGHEARARRGSHGRGGDSIVRFAAHKGFLPNGLPSLESGVTSSELQGRLVKEPNPNFPQLHTFVKALKLNDSLQGHVVLSPIQLAMEQYLKEMGDQVLKCDDGSKEGGSDVAFYQPFASSLNASLPELVIKPGLITAKNALLAAAVLKQVGLAAAIPEMAIGILPAVMSAQDIGVKYDVLDRNGEKFLVEKKTIIPLQSVEIPHEPQVICHSGALLLIKPKDNGFVVEPANIYFEEEDGIKNWYAVGVTAQVYTCENEQVKIPAKRGTVELQYKYKIVNYSPLRVELIAPVDAQIDEIESIDFKKEYRMAFFPSGKGSRGSSICASRKHSRTSSGNSFGGCDQSETWNALQKEFESRINTGRNRKFRKRNRSILTDIR